MSFVFLLQRLDVVAAEAEVKAAVTGTSSPS